jgi:CheY-like chemotaxis protein
VEAGTNCVVMMPLSFCQPADIEPPDLNLMLPMLKDPLKFLIIDDIKMNRMMLRRRIEKNICPNCRISEASTGESALEICRHEKFDIIIVDHYMEEAGGVMVGTDVVYAMRRMKIDSIIIGCSGNDLVEEFSQAGADWVWQKPMPSNAMILAHLSDALTKKRNDKN